MKKLIIIESPFRGNNLQEREDNLGYVKRCCSHVIQAGHVPFASHMFFPQFLDEDDVFERRLGIELGYQFWVFADEIWFFLDRGWSPGMQQAYDKAIKEKRMIKQTRIFSMAS